MDKRIMLYQRTILLLLIHNIYFFGFLGSATKGAAEETITDSSTSAFAIASSSPPISNKDHTSKVSDSKSNSTIPSYGGVGADTKYLSDKDKDNDMIINHPSPR